jgi:hypothetical protein
VERPYRVEYRPEFIASQKRHGISDEDLVGFILDLVRAPRALKDAHPLTLPSAFLPFWSAKISTRGGQFLVTYTICDGLQKTCHGHPCDLSGEYDCKQPIRRIVIRKLGRHDETYRETEKLASRIRSPAEKQGS